MMKYLSTTLTLLLFFVSGSVGINHRKLNFIACEYFSQVKELVDGTRRKDDICMTKDKKLLKIVGLRKKSKKEYISGESIIYISNVFISKENLLHLGNDSEIKLMRSHRAQNILNEEEKFLGNKTVLVVREETNNLNASTLSDEIFGIDEDAVNLKTQYSKCSFGKLNFYPFNGTTVTGETIFNGIGEVKIDLNETGTNMRNIENAMVDAVIQKYGSIEDQFDYIMLAVPPSTNMEGTVAYAIPNHYLSVYREDRIILSMVQIHEVGHNLGLAHSDEVHPYQDRSGHMGMGKYSDDYYACFNGAKSFQLGWYSGSYFSLNPTNSNFEGKIVGVVDYDKRDNMMTVIEMKGSSNGVNYYIAFNRKQGMNSGTNEGGDQVMITSYKGSGYSNSNLEAKLSEGDEKTFHDYTSSIMITIKVKEIYLSDDLSVPSYADISITSENKRNEITTDPPGQYMTNTISIIATSSPTQQPTSTITGSPTKSPVKQRKGCERKKGRCHRRKRKNKNKTS